MLDRESTFADPGVIELLKTKFIPVAIDQAYQRRQKDAEGEFYRKIALQGPRHDFKNGTTQGLYAAAADGTFLGFTNNRGAGRVRRMMDKALETFRPSEAKAIDPGKSDAQFNPKPPEGGLVIRVNSKVLGGWPETDDKWQKIFQQGIGRDNLWSTKAEHEQLAAGKLADSFLKRLARYHLVDNTRGEPPMWRENEIRSLDLKLDDGKLTGTVHLETEDGKRGFTADVYGLVETKDGRVTRFDVVAKGRFWGSGRYTLKPPPGKFPFAVAFRLADGTDTADGIPPQGSRGWVRGYIR